MGTRGKQIFFETGFETTRPSDFDSGCPPRISSNLHRLRHLARATCVIGLMTEDTRGTSTHNDLADRAAELDETPTFDHALTVALAGL